MRAASCLILALAVLSLASCGGGDEQNRGKQTTISAGAYPAVEKFLTSSVSCKKLADVSRQDRIAGVIAKTCTKSRALVQSTKRILPLVIKRCASAARTRQATVIRRCIADRGEPLMSRVLRDFERLARTYSRDLVEVVKPGPCLSALKWRQSAIDAVVRVREALPAAMKRVRSGDLSGLEAILRQLDIRFGRAPTACKP